ncbi:uncharacterized protein LOC108912930 [Anoplophora glabripennis]|uniref:uncharacterized protein LOC108912930 n=1 Tax=Anoplophora glabripennis TaxID=217634 RepID=UPI000873516A|nr:uncharacterized protein LOC108912930 [Anoplophora glabripennis]
MSQWNSWKIRISPITPDSEISFKPRKPRKDEDRDERNKTRQLEKCCPGFIQRDHHCISKCGNCQNGICKEEICHCAPGFSGINCDTRCTLGLWGQNCTNVCNCSSEFCNPTDGSCVQNTYKSIRSEENDSTTLEAYQSKVYEEKLINQTTETVSVSTNVNSVEDWYNNNVKSAPREETVSNFISNRFSTTTEPITTNIYATLPTDHTAIKKNNLTLDKYQTKVENILDSLKKTKNKTQGHPNVRHNLVNDNEGSLIPVGIQYDQIARPLMQETTTPSTTEEEKYYLEEGSKTDTTKIPSKEYYFFNSISVSAATTVALILLALVIVTIKRKYKHKQKVDNKKNDVLAVYTTSIFHTPLPDPPTCENPSYLSSLECQTCLSEPTVKTCTVYSMNTSNQTKPDCKNYEYDYPPSSGSYRAASIIEPLDANVNQRPIFIQTEPVYDEIPCRGDFESMIGETPESETVSLYMNTGGLRKVQNK